jgi:hypothetical protein
MPLHPAVCLDDLSRIRRSGQNLRNESVRVQGDRRDELLQRLRGLLHGRWRLLLVGLARWTGRFGLRSESRKKTTKK